MIHKLKNIFGFDSFKKGQEEVITRILDGRSVLAVFPTGGGKSLCFQYPVHCSRKPYRCRIAPDRPDERPGGSFSSGIIFMPRALISTLSWDEVKTDLLRPAGK